jgi:hypothetical protein
MSDPRTSGQPGLRLRRDASGGSIFGKDEDQEQLDVHPAPRSDRIADAGQGFTFRVHRLSSL